MLHAADHNSKAVEERDVIVWFGGQNDFYENNISTFELYTETEESLIATHIKTLEFSTAQLEKIKKQFITDYEEFFRNLVPSIDLGEEINTSISINQSSLGPIFVQSLLEYNTDLNFRQQINKLNSQLSSVSKIKHTIAEEKEKGLNCVKGADILMVNSRDVLGSKCGKRAKTSNDLITDGIAQVQYLLDQGTPPARITLQGQFMGGG